MQSEINSGSEKMSPELVKLFTRDSLDLLDNLEKVLLDMSESPAGTTQLNDAFRYMHTFKGNCLSFGHNDLARLSHACEELFVMVRDGHIKLTSVRVRTLLSIIDLFRKTVANVLEQNSIAHCEILIKLLEDIKETSSSNGMSEVPGMAGESVEIHNGREGGIETNKNSNTLNGSPAFEAGRASTAETREDIRVSVDKIEGLVDLSGELSTAELMLFQNEDLLKVDSESLDYSAQHLRMLIGEIQQMSMSFRLLPVEGLFQKMKRVVYETSAVTEKSVQFITDGGDTQADRRVIELLTDPLSHLVRNSIGHGIEDGDIRSASGKNKQGLITVSARQEGNEVVIELTDDGRGLDKKAILKRAAELDLNFGDEDDDSYYDLIFRPGFSTAESVTGISGRGVGLDVVKKNIEKLQGHVFVKSAPGKGCTFEIRIPLTLAIIEGQLIEVGNNKFIIPVLSIVKTFQAQKGSIISTGDGIEYIKEDDQVIPVIRLSDLLGIEENRDEIENGLLVMVRHGDRVCCLAVDNILEKQSTMIKNISNYVGELKNISGCTILGDGKVCLILNIGAIVSCAVS